MTDTNDGSLQLFLRGFAARDLAEPLLSFDESTAAVTMRAAIADRPTAAVAIRRAGEVVGWLTREDLAGDAAPQSRSPASAAILDESASLDQVVAGLHTAPCVLVLGMRQISGVIGRQDVQKPAMRMWLFGLVTILELRVTRMIDECCPQETWREFLSPGRIQKAEELRQERLRRGQHPSLLDCLQFADKGQIVARETRLRERTRFASKSQVEGFVKSLQDLRNNLAHAQDIAGDWDVIHELATNLLQVVAGPR